MNIRDTVSFFLQAATVGIVAAFLLLLIKPDWFEQHAPVVQVQQAAPHTEHHLSSLDGNAPVLVVSVSRANLRGGPASSYSVVKQLAYGVVVTQLEHRGNWYHVRVRNGGDGWIHSSLVR